MPRYPVRPADAALSSDGGVVAVDRALTLLTAFREGDEPLTLLQLSERIQLVRSTTLRLLASLLHFDFVQRLPDGRYMLGSTVARLQKIYAASFSLDTMVPEALRQLVNITRESASFHVKQGDQRLVLYRVNSPQSLSDQSRAGDLLPLDRGAGGHLIQAFSGAEGSFYDTIRRQWQVATPVSDRTTELSGISSPVFDAHQQFVGAVTLIMPAQRYNDAHRGAVLTSARDLTHKLGGRFQND